MGKYKVYDECAFIGCGQNTTGPVYSFLPPNEYINYLNFMRLSFSCELDLFLVSSLLVNSHCSYDYSYCIKRFLLKNLVMEMCIHYIYPIYVLNLAKIFCIYKFVNIPKMKVIKEIERFRIIDQSSHSSK